MPPEWQEVRRSCLDGDPTACHRLADALMAPVTRAQGSFHRHLEPVDGIAGDEFLAVGFYRLANRLYREGCSGNRVEHCSALSILYSAGLGVAWDRRRALEFNDRGCAAGRADDCFEAAQSARVLHSRGEMDVFRTPEYLARACELGHRDACRLYEDATRTVREVQEAIEGCESGAAAACARAAKAHRRAETVPQNLARAVTAYERACEGRDAEACWELGEMYLKGYEIDQDLLRALAYQDTACFHGLQVACTEVEFTRELIESLRER